MDVSIIIRTKNEGKNIERTLNIVREQKFSAKYEIIIVDSGSTDGTLRTAKRHAVQVLQIPEQDFSYGGSLNIGCGKASGELLVNLSAHAFPTDDHWLEKLAQGFADNDVAGVYGRQRSAGDVNPFDARRNALFFGEQKRVFNSKNGRIGGVHFSNSNCAVRKDIWQRFNFDERVPYAEDLLWQAEVLNAGYSIVYEPAAVVWHTHDVNIGSAFKNARGCAYALSVMKRKRRFIPLIAYDLAVALGEGVCSLYQDAAYIWRKGCRSSLKIAPLYVMASELGWVAGRVKYRTERARFVAKQNGK